HRLSASWIHSCSEDSLRRHQETATRQLPEVFVHRKQNSRDKSIFRLALSRSVRQNQSREPERKVSGHRREGSVRNIGVRCFTGCVSQRGRRLRWIRILSERCKSGARNIHSGVHP